MMPTKKRGSSVHASHNVKIIVVLQALILLEHDHY